MSLVFYDTETTGLETFFDQILQFAAIHTDDELNEIERFSIRCRLLPHVVPAPGAMIVTGVKVSQLTHSSHVSHYEMARAICEKFLAWSPALFIGWNSIDFDEILVRQTLYKTLHNPYVTSRVGNSRSDVMRIVQACSLFAPDALIFPTNEDGNRVFKLDRVAPANGFNHDFAHDAMADVEAAIFLSRLIADKAPNIWSSFMRFSKKASVTEYINDETVFCLSDFFFGKPYSYMVTTIGQNQENKADWYVYNLSIDPASLLSLSEAELIERLEQSPKPVRRLKSNAAPIIFPADDAVELSQGKECGAEELHRRAEILKGDTNLRERLISAFESRKQEYPSSAHVEKQIYDGFIGKADEKLMDQFHKTEWSKRHPIIEKFQDPRLRKIGRHLIYLEQPHLLDSDVCHEYDLAAAKRLLGHGGDICWLTLPLALEQLEGMLAEASTADSVFLQEHLEYLRQRHEMALSCIQ